VKHFDIRRIGLPPTVTSSGAVLRMACALVWRFKLLIEMLFILWLAISRQAHVIQWLAMIRYARLAIFL